MWEVDNLLYKEVYSVAYNKVFHALKIFLWNLGVSTYPKYTSNCKFTVSAYFLRSVLIN